MYLNEFLRKPESSCKVSLFRIFIWVIHFTSVDLKAHHCRTYLLHIDIVKISEFSFYLTLPDLNVDETNLPFDNI